MGEQRLDRFSVKPGPGRVIAMTAGAPCPLCGEPAAVVRIEAGLRYVDPWFDTYRWGTWEELGAAERWETVYFCPEFDRIVVEPCTHAARGTRAVQWRAQLAAAAAPEVRRGINLRKPLLMQMGANSPTSVRFRGAATVQIPVVPATPAGQATQQLTVPLRVAGRSA
jgi:hypothetical protein